MELHFSEIGNGWPHESRWGENRDVSFRFRGFSSKVGLWIGIQFWTSEKSGQRYKFGNHQHTDIMNRAMAHLQNDRYNLIGQQTDDAGQNRSRATANPLRVKEKKCRTWWKGWLQ